MVQFIQTFTAALLASSVVAHGDINREIARRQAHLNHPNRRAVGECKRDLVETGWVREQHQRREERLHELRVAAGFAKPHELVRRNVEEVERSYGNNSTCTLDPEQTVGPYWVWGETIRSDIVTGEKGPKAYVDLNLIDVNTCKPLVNTYVELWGCNATGVYTGVQSRVNGDGSASSLNSNALRGIQPTDANGTASFITIIPGHYIGRTNHLHTVVHQDPDIYPNHTLINGSISHVGQFYFQQHFLDELAKVYPYYENKQEVVRNDQDDLFIEASKSGDDPYMKISLIGDKIEDGLYATIDVGVNPKAYRGPAPVNMWTEHGTEPLEDSPWTGYPDTCLACQPPSSSPSAAAQTNVPAKE